jgi:polyhydroxyalkanoate synthesis regulator phasin
MSNPVLQAFFVGRALADSVREQVENTVASAIGELSKFDADQRVNLRNFTEQVLSRAQQDVTTQAPMASVDLQETIDNLRAEVAQLRDKLREIRDSRGQ